VPREFSVGITGRCSFVIILRIVNTIIIFDNEIVRLSVCTVIGQGRPFDIDCMKITLSPYVKSPLKEVSE